MTATAPRIVRFQGGKLDNGAFGFPRGEERKVQPWVLMCLHITGNRRTAAMPEGIGRGTGTYAEVAYMARPRTAADIGNSAHDYIARDGSVLACIPTRYAAWNNGTLLRPNVELESVQRIVRRDQTDRDFNPNEAYVREVECTGYPGSFPVTKAQRETVAYLVARDSIRWELPISRETVHMHRDLDSVNRASCPFTGDQEDQIGRIIQRARDIKRELRDPEPDPEPEPDDDELERLRAALEAAEGEVEALTERLADSERARALEREKALMEAEASVKALRSPA